MEKKSLKLWQLIFRDRMGDTGYLFSKKPEIIDDKALDKNDEDIFKNITMLDLYNLYNDLINRYRNKINQKQYLT